MLGILECSSVMSSVFRKRNRFVKVACEATENGAIMESVHMQIECKTCLQRRLVKKEVD